VTLAERRIGLLFAGFLALLALAGVRAFQLGVIDRAKLVDAASSQQLIQAEVPARRGTIVDRHGQELAVSEASADITATPYLLKNKVRVAQRLATILGMPEGDVLNTISKKSGFEYIAKGVPQATADKVHALKVEGIDLTPGYKRFYPRATLASQVLGIVGADGLGKTGLEYSLNTDLHGVNGARSTVRDGVGDSVKIRDTIRTQPGAPIKLTIDSAIQSKVEKVLAGIGQTYSPKGATALVTNPKTGEILAMANWPAINANKPLTASAYVAQNRAVGYTYEPGSTFKAITIAGALQDRVVTPNTEFFLPPTLQVSDRVIRESHPRGPLSLAVKDILAQSSNVGAVKIAQKMGQKSFDTWARRFGFGTKTGIDLPGEEQGLLLKESDYSGASIGNLPIGQGLSVTPLQMAQAYTAIANGGVLRRPHLVRAIGNKPTPLPAGKRIISRQTAAQLRSMLKGVFAPGGTAAEVSLPGYDLAGKTGTAQKIDTATGTYSDTRFVSSFIGFAPARDPGVLISVMVDEPHGASAGGSVAAPAFGKIAAFALPYLGVPPR
jgi:cell division protein FtsI (penicillin-binding protein 3)